MNRYILGDLSFFQYHILIVEHHILLNEFRDLKKKTRMIYLLANAVNNSPAIKNVVNTNNLGSWDLFNYHSLLTNCRSLAKS
jgi:hypothetical protein